MASIVELYRQHKDLLSPYFKSEEEAADCERRAEMGDDRAMRVLSLAYDARIPKTHTVTATIYMSVASSDRPETVTIYDAVDQDTRNKFHRLAIQAANNDAMDYAKSVELGNRSLLTAYPEWQPELKAFDWIIDNHYLVDYREFTKIQNGPAKAIEYHLAPKQTLRHELQQNADADGHRSNFHILFHNSKKYDWPSDRRVGDTKILQLDKRYLAPLEMCARGGSVEAARTLASVYNQHTFREKRLKKFFFSDTSYHNPLHDSAKAKHWERVAEHLEGKSATPIEREKFLQEFLYSQDKTPEGLYNIGYALCHNKHIGDFNRGIDYLKHAANLGDANAARELGEQYHTSAEANQNNPEQMKLAHFWYKVAASTPMKVAGEDGKVVNYDGHPNAKARVAYLEKAFPELKNAQMNEAELRNPSREHIRQYPASMWAAEIPITDVSDLVRNPAHGGIVARMEGAVRAIDSHVKEFEVMTGAIQAKIDDLIARQAVLDGRVEGLKGSEISALRHNDDLSRQQLSQDRLAQLAKDRWVKETMSSLTSTIPLNILTGGGDVIVQLGRNATRAAGFRGARDNEVAFREMLIAELEAQKIDVSRCGTEIKALTEVVQQVADSGPMQRLRKDETRSRAVVEGYLRQKILKSGLENCHFLEDYSKQNGIDSVDALLTAFEKQDARLHQALSNLCYGHANSNDMAVLLEDVNAMRGDALQPHEKALKRFVERVVKGNIAHYMTRASQIDVIADLKLIDFDTMSVDHSKATGDLIRGTRELSAEEHGSRQVDAATRLALTSMFSNQFGVTHIGQYDVTRMFSYFLHRHGKDELIAAELHDGQVTDGQQPKRVSLKTTREMQGFVERAKESAHRGRDSQPDVGDLFMRVCGYEYYLPQAVITSGRGNRFKENPEAPIAYPMINRVVQNFIQRMSLTDIATYRQQVGDKLDSVIAQTFIDFFQQAGREHAQKFSVERERLRDAHSNDNYGPRFDAYEDKITDDVLAKFSEFVKIYERNLVKSMQVTPEHEAEILQQQIASLHQNAKAYLAPSIPQAGSHEARELARKTDHRGTNMTEGWRFTG